MPNLQGKVRHREVFYKKKEHLKGSVLTVIPGVPRGLGTLLASWGAGQGEAPKA